MSRHLDENVVKMRFDNQDFNRNVESSDEKLKGFKNTITSLPSSIEIGLKGLLANTSLGDILNFAAITTGIHGIKSEIESIANPIETVASKALNAVSNVVTATVNQINTGGKQRALDIAQARFQIEGLKLDVDTFMEAANFAVEGTAYGLNEAALVASQLGASGITELDELKKALRAVSGVAAMTNKSYAEMGHLFTTVASNGKLMTQQIRSFSYAGLNVSEKLAKYLGVTESDIAELVKKGQIDFKTFYTAMDEAFGEHAKDANKTFTGAISNIKAALNRIGEGIWTPIITETIDVLNKVRVGINELKAELVENEVFNKFSEVIRNICRNLELFVDNVRAALTESQFISKASEVIKVLLNLAESGVSAFNFDYAAILINIGNNFSVVVNKVKDVIVAVSEAFDEIFGLSKIAGEFQSALLWISELVTVVDYLSESDIQEVFENWFQTIKDVYLTIKDILGIDKKSIGKVFTDVAKAVLDLFKQLKLTDEESKNLQKTFGGLASAVDIIKMLFVELLKFVSPVLDYIRPVGDFLLDLTAKLGDGITSLRNSIVESGTFEKFFDGLTQKIVTVLDYAKKFGGNFIDIFFGGNEDTLDEKKGFIGKIFDFFKKVIEFIGSLFKDLNIQGLDLSPIQKIFDSIANFGFDETGEVADKETPEDKVEKLENTFNTILNVLNKVKDFIKGLGDVFGINNKLEESKDKVNNFFDFVYQIIGGIANGFWIILEAFGDMDSSDRKDVLIKLLESVTAIYTTTWIYTYKILDTLRDVSIWVPIVKTITSIITDIASSLKSISSTLKNGFDPEGVIKGIGTSLESFVKAIGKLDLADIIHGKEKVSDILKAVAWLIIAIAAALFAISIIPADNLSRSLKALLSATLTIGGVMAVLVILAKVCNTASAKLNTNKGATSIKNLVEQVTMFSDPLSDFAKVFKAIGLALVEFAASVYIITKAQTIGGDVGTAFWSLGLMISGIVGIITLFATLKKDKDIGLSSFEYAGLAAVFAAIGLACLAIGSAMALIINSTKDIPYNELDRVWLAFGVIELIIGTVMGLMVAIIAVSKDTDGASAILSGAGIYVIFIGITKIIKAITKLVKELSSIELDKLNVVMSAVNGILIILGAIAGIFALVTGLFGSSATPQAALVLLGVAGALLAFAAQIAAVGGAIKQVGYVLDAFTKLIETIQKLFEYMSKIDDSEVERIVENFGKIFGGMALAIPGYLIASTAAMEAAFGKFFDSLVKIAIIKGIPAFDLLSKMLTPAILRAILNLLIELNGYLPEIQDEFENLLFGRLADEGILEAIRKWFDRIWDDTADWLLKRIPILVVDIYNVVITLIRAINDVMEENWDELNEELQRLIDNSIKLLEDLITGEKTLQDVGGLIGTLASAIITALENNKEPITEAFRAFGAAIADGLKEGFLENMPDSIFDLMNLTEDEGEEDDSGLFGKAFNFIRNKFDDTGMPEESSGWRGFNQVPNDLLSGVSEANGAPSNNNGILGNVFDKINEGLNSIMQNNKSSNTYGATININNKSDPNGVYNTTAEVDKRKSAAGYKVLSNNY